MMWYLFDLLSDDEDDEDEILVVGREKDNG